MLLSKSEEEWDNAYSCACDVAGDFLSLNEKWMEMFQQNIANHAGVITYLGEGTNVDHDWANDISIAKATELG